MNPLTLFSQNRHMRAHYNDIQALSQLQDRLEQYLMTAKGRKVILLCIGTDRSTGDSLGPLTGTKLSQKGIPGLIIIGTLEKPVHAENLKTTMEEISTTYNDPYIVAIDACLGRLDSVGYITLSEGPLRPGTAVKKELPEVGDIHLTGIVNITGFMQYMVLQNTRLHTVWQMTDVIYNLFCRICLHTVRY